MSKEIGRRLQELRRSNSATKHQDARTRRQRTRTDKDKKAVENSLKEE